MGGGRLICVQIIFFLVLQTVVDPGLPTGGYEKLLLSYFPKNRMKIKEIGPWGRPSLAPPGSTNDSLLLLLSGGGGVTRRKLIFVDIGLVCRSYCCKLQIY